MLYHHLWGPPSVVVVRQDGRPVHTPQQVCVQCGTSRNPLTGRLIRTRGGDWCRNAVGVQQRDYRRLLTRVEQQLTALEQDGLDVDREHGRKGDGRLELPLAYKD